MSREGRVGKGIMARLDNLLFNEIETGATNEIQLLIDELLICYYPSKEFAGKMVIRRKWTL